MDTGPILNIKLSVDIYPQSHETSIVVFDTPQPVWDIIPKKEIHIDTDYCGVAYFLKQFIITFKRRDYNFTFYQARKRIKQ